MIGRYGFQGVDLCLSGASCAVVCQRDTYMLFIVVKLGRFLCFRVRLFGFCVLCVQPGRSAPYDVCVTWFVVVTVADQGRGGGDLAEGFQDLGVAFLDLRPKPGAILF